MLAVRPKPCLIVWCREGIHHDLGHCKLDDQHPLSTSPAILTEPILLSVVAVCIEIVPGISGSTLFSASGRLPSAGLTSDAVEGLTAAELLLGLGS